MVVGETRRSDEFFFVKNWFGNFFLDSMISQRLFTFPTRLKIDSKYVLTVVI